MPPEPLIPYPWKSASSSAHRAVPAKGARRHQDEGAIVYAIVRTSGHQEKVAVGDQVLLNRVAGQPGDAVELGDPLRARNHLFKIF